MMNKLFLLFTFLIIGTVLHAQPLSSQPSSQPTIKAPVMTFDQMKLDLGKVKRGEVREFSFPFTNTGNAPLQIDLVSSCDCTTTDYPKGVIAPGETGIIEVKFDSTEKEESEEIDIDIFLRQEDPKTGAPIIYMLQYTYDLIVD